jgi:hypothetical protein
VGGGDAAGCHRCTGQGREGGDNGEEPPAALEMDESGHAWFSLHSKVGLMSLEFDAAPGDEAAGGDYRSLRRGSGQVK